jgi:hypothetical protein
MEAHGCRLPNHQARHELADVPGELLLQVDGRLKEKP